MNKLRHQHRIGLLCSVCIAALAIGSSARATSWTAARLLRLEECSINLCSTPQNQAAESSPLDVALAPPTQWSVGSSSHTGDMIGLAERDQLGDTLLGFGDQAFVAAPGRTFAENGQRILRAGAVYVTRWDPASSEWSTRQELVPSPATATRDGSFGTAIAAQGDYLFIGAPQGGTPEHPNAGVVYVYRSTPRAPVPWTLEQTLTADEPQSGALFGISLAVDQGTLVVGAPGASSVGIQSGSTYCFERQSVNGQTQWRQTETLALFVARNTGDKFGSSVAISGNTIAVGAIGTDLDQKRNSGIVHMFTKAGLWLNTQGLTPPFPTAGDRFGWTMAFHQDELYVGSPFRRPRSSTGTMSQERGDVTVYSWSPGEQAWTFDQQIAPPPGRSYDFFGFDLKVSGDVLAVGNPGFGLAGEFPLLDTPIVGSALLFTRDATSDWTYELGLDQPQEDESLDFSGFGASVALTQQHVIVGAPAGSDKDRESTNLSGIAAFFGPDATVRSVNDASVGSPLHMAYLASLLFVLVLVTGRAREPHGAA